MPNPRIGRDIHIKVPDPDLTEAQRLAAVHRTTLSRVLRAAITCGLAADPHELAAEIHRKPHQEPQ